MFAAFSFNKFVLVIFKMIEYISNSYLTIYIIKYYIYSYIIIIFNYIYIYINIIKNSSSFIESPPKQFPPISYPQNFPRRGQRGHRPPGGVEGRGGRGRSPKKSPIFFAKIFFPRFRPKQIVPQRCFFPEMFLEGSTACCGRSPLGGAWGGERGESPPKIFPTHVSSHKISPKGLLRS